MDDDTKVVLALIAGGVIYLLLGFILIILSA